MKLEGQKLWRRLDQLTKDTNQSGNARMYLGATEVLSEQLPHILGRISSTFPHYTSHSLDHSITILNRIGLCLPATSLKKLTATEIYILIASALLHDVGMVTSEGEYKEIEKQDSFKELCDTSRFRPYYQASETAMASGDIWAATFNRRFLVAEWVRRRHADRSADFVLALPKELAAARCNDRDIAEAIAKVCRAHGLNNRLLLEDHTEFPRDCIIRNDSVDLAFCAVLLRLGDLLDLGHERACPLVRNLIDPLPDDSAAHWGRHEATRAPTVRYDGIRIVARCESQSEHAVLHSWCNWLRDEAIYCDSIASQSDRFTMSLGPPEVDIKPRSVGSYEFRQYRFEFDDEQILEQLFGERLYGNRSLFVRELLQNAIDATRCKIMHDVQNGMFDEHLNLDGQSSRPSDPRSLPLEIREEYAIQVTLQKWGDGWRLEVEDRGIGMDHNMIQNYLLKVGRSYYRSSEFGSQYKFRPISEFGIGLLSCFMVADNIDMETLGAGSDDGAISLRIPPWRKFVLSKPGSRVSPGTRVRLVLHSIDWLPSSKHKPFLGLDHEYFLKLDEELGRHVPESDFGRLLQSLVRHVEFPVFWRDDATHGVIQAPWEGEHIRGEWRRQGKKQLWHLPAHSSRPPGVVFQYLGDFERSDSTYFSKEGIACCSTEHYSQPKRHIKIELDFRGPKAPRLTVNRLGFTGFIPRHKAEEAVAKNVERLVSEDEVAADFLAARLPSPPPFNLSDMLLQVYEKSPGGKIRLLALNELFPVARSATHLQIEKKPGEIGAAPKGSGTPEEGATFVVPFIDPRAKIESWSLILMRLSFETLNGFPAKWNPIPTYREDDFLDSNQYVFSERLKVDIEPWKVIRIAPRHWMLSGEASEQLRIYFDNRLPVLRPHGNWKPWGAIVHLGSIGKEFYRSFGQPRSRPPREMRLRGAAYVMQTLRQNIPDIEREFITDEDIPLPYRNMGFPGDLLEWRDEGLLDELRG